MTFFGNARPGKRSKGYPPAILMGGNTSTVSIARSLGKEGISSYLLIRPDSPVIYSRYAQYIPLKGKDEKGEKAEAWIQYLLGTESNPLHGAVLLACSDDGIEILIGHREELSKKYILDISNIDAQKCFLNKLSTYQKAREAGVPTPRFWMAGSVEQVIRQRDEYIYPLIVKPLYSHRFQAIFGDKFFQARNFAELMEAYGKVRFHNLEVMLVEMIPGSDDLLCSYYTYMDEKGLPLFDFTKRIIRRYPENRGIACYHITDWIPEARDFGIRMFNHVGLLGLGNIEFKLDKRDGKLKIIECNARFTAANGLLVESGYDLGMLVYSRLVGKPHPVLKGKRYKQGLRLWYPLEDLRAFLELRSKGELTFGTWLASLVHYQVLPYFRFTDPMPSLIIILRFLRRLVETGKRRLKRNRKLSAVR